MKKIVILTLMVLLASLVYATTPVDDITDIAVVGKTTLNHNWKTVTHNANITDPVVIAKPLTVAGGGPAVVRLRNVDANSFDIRVQEWTYQDGSHATETISYMVIPEGEYEIAGKKLFAGTASVTDQVSTVNFASTFNETPVVIANMQTFDDSEPATNRNDNVDLDSFDVFLQEEENSTNSSHGTETLGYVAAEPGNYNDVSLFEVGSTGNSVTHQWYQLSFLQNMGSDPYFFADMQTTDGGNTANVRQKNLNSTGVMVKIHEEKSLDSEVGHNDEEVGYFVIN